MLSGWYCDDLLRIKCCYVDQDWQSNRVFSIANVHFVVSNMSLKYYEYLSVVPYLQILDYE